MSDTKPQDLTSFNSDRVAQLTREFNTHKGFGMMGALEAAESAFAFPPDNTQATNTAPPAAAPAPVSTEPDPKQLEQILNPINTAMQEFKQSQMQELQGIRNQMSELRQARETIPAPVVTGEGQPAADPFGAKLQDLEGKYQKVYAQSVYDRSLNALQQAKQKYPDADISEKDLQDLWNHHNINTNPNNLHVAEQTNWAGHWEQVAAAKQAPKWQSRLKELEAENAQLKNNKPSVLEQLGAVPAARGRNAMANAPSVVEGPDGTDDDIYNYANSRMSRGAFRGFGRLLNEGRLQKQLRGAS